MDTAQGGTTIGPGEVLNLTLIYVPNFIFEVKQQYITFAVEGGYSPCKSNSIM
jgi:hypothetical protein